MAFKFQGILFIELLENTIESIHEFMDEETSKRINFASSHASA